MTAASIEVANFVFGWDELKVEAFRRLELENRAQAERLDRVFDQMRSDTFVISRTPSIDGLIRSLRSPDGVDPNDGSSVKDWHDRLAQIMTIFLRERPIYTQARYIGLADNGRELVRVERRHRAIHTVREDLLQQKGAEAYMKMVPKLGRGEAWFSPVTYNRERGRLDRPFTPTIRVVLPVFDDNARVFGAIVLNADFEQLLIQARPLGRPDYQFTAIQDERFFMILDEAVAQPRLHFSDSSDEQELPLPKELKGLVDGMNKLADGDLISHVMPVLPNASGESGFKTVATTRSSALLYPLRKASYYSLAVTLGVLSVITLTIALIVIRMTGPLRRLLTILRSEDPAREILGSGIEASGEIGDLINGFKNVSDNLIRAKKDSRSGFGGVVDGALMLDADAAILSLNPAGEQLLGYAEQDVLGRPFEMFLGDSSRGRWTALIESLRSGTAQDPNDRHGLQGVKRDGTPFGMETLVSRVTVSGATLFVVLIRNSWNEAGNVTETRAPAALPEPGIVSPAT